MVRKVSFEMVIVDGNVDCLAIMLLLLQYLSQFRVYVILK